MLAVLDQGLYSICNFVVAVMISRSCGVAEYGFYVLGCSLLVACQAVGRSLVWVPLTIRYASLGPDRRRSCLGSALLQQVALSLALAVVLLAAAGTVLVLAPDSPLPGVMAAVAVSGVAWLTLDFFRAACLTRLAPGAGAALSAAANLGTLVLMLTAQGLGLLSAPMAFLLTACGAAAPSLWVLLRKRQEARFAPNLLRDDWRANWKLGKWALAAAVVNNLSVRSLPWLVLTCHTNKEVALLGALMTVAGLVNPAIIGLASYLTPRLCSSAASHGLAHVAGRARQLVGLAAFAAAAHVALIAVIGNDLVRLFFAPAFGGHKLALLLLAAAIGLEAMYVPARSLLRVMSQTRSELWASLASLAAAGIGGVFLIPPLGVLGAALTYAASRLALLLTGQFLTLAARHKTSLTGQETVRPARPRLVFDRETVIKNAGVEHAALEAAKTQAAHELGRRCGLFSVPRVIACDSRKGLIRLERLFCLVPANELLRGLPGELDFLHSIGRAIAAVHQELRLSPDRGSTAVWAVPTGATPVLLHGDFNTSNVCVRTDTGQVVLLDWSSALPGGFSVGSRYVDLAQFLRSLVVHPTPYRTALRRFELRAGALLEGYQAQTRQAVDVDELRDFIGWVNVQHLRRILRSASPLRVLPRAAKCFVGIIVLWRWGRRLRAQAPPPKRLRTLREGGLPPVPPAGHSPAAGEGPLPLATRGLQSRQLAIGASGARG